MTAEFVKKWANGMATILESKEDPTQEIKRFLNDLGLTIEEEERCCLNAYLWQ